MYPNEANFFLSPESPPHRQYEALRAFFVQGLNSPPKVYTTLVILL